MNDDILSSSISVSSIVHRKQFHCAKKNANETYTDWYYRLLALSRMCDFGAATNAFLLDKFVFGLDDYHIDRLCTELDVITLVKSVHLLNESSTNGQQENQLIDLSELISNSIKVELGEGDLASNLKNETRPSDLIESYLVNRNEELVIFYLTIVIFESVDI